MPIDLVIAAGPQALDFLITRRTWLFPDSPLIFGGIADDSVLLKDLPTSVVGIISRFDPGPTVELALQLQPNAKRLVVVTGAAAFDRYWDEKARRTLRPYEDRLAITHLSGLPMDNLLGEVARLTPDSIVLYLSHLQDGTGRSFIPVDTAEKLAKVSGAPIYALYDSILGHGIVGGRMTTFEEIGRAVGRLGSRALSGEGPETLTPGPPQPLTVYVDWRQLQRWGLDRQLLPRGSVVRFKQPSLWETYRPQIIVGIGLFAMQSLLIPALLLQARRRRRAEMAVRESEERMALATTSAHLGLWHWDAASNQLWMSEICREILALGPQANLTLETFIQVVQRQDLISTPSSRERMPTALDPDKVERQLLLPDGSEHWIRTVGRTTFDSSGRPTRMMGVVIDVTHEKITERESTHWRHELTHLTRVATLGELSGAMAHELNQPLAAILSNADAGQLLLTAKNCNITEIVEILRDIVAETTRAGEVIRHLRALFAKTDAQIRPLDLNEVVVEVLKLVHSDLVARRIDVSSRLARDLPPVRGDRVQLQQVLLNLIFNACDAMAENAPGERKLLVLTTPEGQRAARLSIADRGRGIEEKMLSRLFKPFVTTKTRGLGLGLSICQSIVDAHGGRLWANNNARRGATFFIALPAEEAHP